MMYFFKKLQDITENRCKIKIVDGCLMAYPRSGNIWVSIKLWDEPDRKFTIFRFDRYEILDNPIEVISKINEWYKEKTNQIH